MSSRAREVMSRFVAGELDEAKAEARALFREGKRAGDLEVIGVARMILGEIAYDQLQYRQARDQLRIAVRELEEALSPVAVEVRQARATLALVLHALSAAGSATLEDAQTELEHALSGLDAPEPPLDLDQANLWVTLAVALSAMQPSPRARSILEAIVNGGLDCAEPENVPAVATAHLHLASVLDDPMEAAEQLERCISLRERAFGSQSLRCAAARFSQAQDLVNAGEVERARAVAKNAMATLRSIGADREPRMSTAHATLGLVEVLSGAVEEGTKHFEAACELEERTFSAGSPQTASMLLLLMQVHAGRRNWGTVMRFGKRVVPVLAELPAHEDGYALACELESTAMLALGRARDAIPRLRAALDGIERRGTLAPPRRAKLWAMLGRCELIRKNKHRSREAFERAHALALDGDDVELADAIAQELAHVRSGGGLRTKGLS